MLDKLLKKLYIKKIKPNIKKYNKAILTIILYWLYQTNFLIELCNIFNINILNLPKTPRIILISLLDLLYIILLLLLHKKEIQKGLNDLKKNFYQRYNLMVKCWVIGLLIMFLSTTIINLFTKQNISSNEALLRNQIQNAPLYMLLTCSVIAPIFEEMVFRLSLYKLIKNKKIFIIFSGLLFGLLHVLGTYQAPIDLLYIIPYSAMGFSFSYLLSKTKNITLPIIIHMIHNTILVLMQIIRG